MATCPYCLEDIKDGATKCPHCQSSLANAQPAPSAPEPVVYVVDQGLIRFGKFAVAILAIFTLVGIYLFGIDIEDTREKLSEAKDEIKGLQDEIKLQKAELDQALLEVDAALSQIRASKEEAVDIVEEMGQTQLSQVETVKADEARESRAIPKERGRLWKPGSTIDVRFLDGSEQLKDAVKAAIDEWLKHANLSVNYTDDANAEIRVSFNEDGSWSYVGTDALAIPASQPTLNYGTLASLDDNSRSQIALHEFGHALGLVHEFQNPNAGELFDQEAVRKEFDYLPEEQIDQLFLKEDTGYPGKRDYDRFSVMNNVFDEKLFLNPQDAPKPGPHLSESDKSYIASLYPN